MPPVLLNVLRKLPFAMLSTAGALKFTAFFSITCGKGEIHVATELDQIPASGTAEVDSYSAYECVGVAGQWKINEKFKSVLDSWLSKTGRQADFFCLKQNAWSSTGVFKENILSPVTPKIMIMNASSSTDNRPNVLLRRHIKFLCSTNLCVSSQMHLLKLEHLKSPPKRAKN